LKADWLSALPRYYGNAGTTTPSLICHLPAGINARTDYLGTTWRSYPKINEFRRIAEHSPPTTAKYHKAQQTYMAYSGYLNATISALK
jgi:hypothetical protein